MATAGEARVRLVVFDWAGTTVDHGCFAPVRPFIEAFAHFESGHVAQARGAHGAGETRSYGRLVKLPAVAAQWERLHARPTEQDVDSLFEQFVPRQLACVESSSQLVPGLLESVAAVRSGGRKISTTTGYFREAAELAYRAAKAQGYEPDFNCCPSDVSTGRPAPWMIYRAMEHCGVYPPAQVLKIGDTVPDVAEGLNAGAWSVGVTRTSSEVGLSEAEVATLEPAELQARLDRAASTLRAAGAHYVIESVAQLPELLKEIDARLARGERPA